MSRFTVLLLTVISTLVVVVSSFNIPPPVHHSPAVNLKQFKKSHQNRNDTEGPLELGTVGEKTFYVERNLAFTWADAKDYAASWNMSLATITTQAEANFFITLPLDTLDYGPYWTAGRDSLLATQYAWDDTGDTIENHFEFFNPDPDSDSCLYYMVWYFDARYIGGGNCATEVWVLLQD